MRLVITRPAEDAGRLAAALRRLGHEPDMHPLLEIVYAPLPPLALDGVAALIATSRNALRGFAENAAASIRAEVKPEPGKIDAQATIAEARTLPVFCVGEATATTARGLGFSDIRTGQGTARELVPIITGDPCARSGTLLYLTGEHLAFDLEAALTAEGLTVRRVTVYEAREVSPANAQHLIDALRAGQVDGVILMSPRTATIFASILTRACPPKGLRAITCYCQSESVAKPLRSFTDLTIAVAGRPTEADLLALIGDGR